MKERDPNQYLFTSTLKSNQPLARETMTRDVNRIIKSALKDSETINESITKMSSRSFRAGYIFELWKEVDNIELAQEYILIEVNPKQSVTYFDNNNKMRVYYRKKTILEQQLKENI